MSLQPNCAIARTRAACGSAMPVVTVKLQARDGKPGLDLERWSG